jgi:Tfp pilus assembly protein PilO
VKKKVKLPLVPIVAVALAVVFIGGLVLVVKPKYDEAGRIDEEIAAIESQSQVVAQQIAVAEAAANEGSTGPKIEVADLFRLAEAMPDADDVSGVVLELDAIARGAGVDLLTITPNSQVAGSGYRALPMQVLVDGGYFEMADFLFRLRTLVTVRNGELDANGRLYTVDQLDVHEGEKGFPNVQAQFLLAAYAYGTGSTAVPLQGQPVPGNPNEPQEASTGGADTSGASEDEQPTENQPADGTDQAALGGEG